MEMQQKFALTPVAGAIAAALAPASQVLAQDDNALEEIIVTATKRTTSVQEIPASIQAITQESIEAMGAKGMEDYSRFIPSVNVVNYGSGSSTVVFRGAITGSSYIAASTSSVYLDEIPVTTTGAQPNVRMVDIERVEALAGPQGTLYGSDAQAGTLRIITNKPKLNEFEAVLDAEVKAGDKSDMSYRTSLVFNIPLVEDKFAMRVVGFSDHDGGFIDNVFGRTPNVSMNTDLPSGWGSLDSSASVEDNWNDADVYGGRVSFLWDVSDSWSMNFTAMQQKTEAGADDYFDPYVGDLQGVRFHNEWREDTFETPQHGQWQDDLAVVALLVRAAQPVGYRPDEAGDLREALEDFRLVAGGGGIFDCGHSGLDLEFFCWGAWRLMRKEVRIIFFTETKDRKHFYLKSLGLSPMRGCVTPIWNPFMNLVQELDFGDCTDSLLNGKYRSPCLPLLWQWRAIQMRYRQC